VIGNIVTYHQSRNLARFPFISFLL